MAVYQRARFVFLPLIWVLAGIPSPSGAQSFAHSYAIVVGITDYSSTQWKDLPYARGDAKAVAQQLKSQGYDTRELYDRSATRDNILTAISTLAKQLQADDRVVLCFSGHGKAETIGKKHMAYVIPYGGTRPDSYISHAELVDAAEQMGAARHIIFILDTCYGGNLITRSGGVSPDRPDYLLQITSRITREVITAGGTDQEVLDSGPDGHSVFASALLKGLAGKADLDGDGYITFAELTSFVMPLASNAYQTPATGVLPGHQGGEYIFLSPLGRVKPQTRNPVPSWIVLKTGDAGQLAKAKKLLQESRYSEATPLFFASAEGGDPEAMVYVGLLYESGWGVKSDRKEARNWFEKAADAGSVDGSYHLWQYCRGSIECTNRVEDFLRHEADAGNATAMLRLGDIHTMYASDFAFENVHDYLDAGAQQELRSAREWYEKAANKREPEAYCKIVHSYELTLKSEGTNGAKGLQEQISYWKQRARVVGKDCGFFF